MKIPTKTEIRVLLLAALSLLLMSCGTVPDKDSTPEKPIVPAFPPPPDTPRFYFQMSLVSSAQVKPQNAESSWRELLTGEKQSSEGLSKPFDVAACQGRVYVSDTTRRRVAVFDFPGRRFFEIGIQEPGLLQKPLGLNTDAQCNVYVADASLKSISVYQKNGTFITTIGGAKWFHRLSHVAVTPAGDRVFAVDTGGVQTQEHHIRVFDVRSGKHLYDIGKRGKGNGEFNLPRDIEMGPDGNLYIVDGANFRVQVLDQKGVFLRSFGSVGTRSGQFSRPKGIAIDPKGNIYVSDTAFGNFQIFNAEGQLLLHVGARSNRPGPAKYLLPAGIDVDEDGRVYFVGQFFRKVDIFRPAELPADKGFFAAGSTSK